MKPCLKSPLIILLCSFTLLCHLVQAIEIKTSNLTLSESKISLKLSSDEKMSQLLNVT